MSVEKLSQRPPEDADALTFTNNEGRETTVSIIEEQVIAQSEHAGIHRARVRVGGRERIFILKEFEDFQKLGAEAWARRSLEAYDVLKKAGVKTWSTYRLEKNSPVILMSDGEREGLYTVSFNQSDSLEELQSLELTGIENFEAVVSAAVSEILHASENGVYLGTDAWMARVDPKDDGSAAMECFIGDLDFVQRRDNSTDEKIRGICEENLSGLRAFFYNFLPDLLGRDGARQYYEAIVRGTNMEGAQF